MPAKFTEAEAKSKRDEILAAAARVFAEKGFEGTTVKQLEKATGLTRGGLFFHFAGKRDLYLAVLRKTLLEEPLAEAASTIGKLALEAESAEASVFAVFQAVRGWHQEHPEAMQFFQQLAVRRDADEDLARLDVEISSTFRQVMTAVIRALQNKGTLNRDIDAATAAALMHGVMDQLMELTLSMSDEEAERVARATFRVMGEGLRPREGAG